LLGFAAERITAGRVGARRRIAKIATNRQIRLTETKIPSTESHECATVCANDISVERVRRGYEPGIVLA